MIDQTCSLPKSQAYFGIKGGEAGSENMIVPEIDHCTTLAVNTLCLFHVNLLLLPHCIRLA